MPTWNKRRTFPCRPHCQFRSHFGGHGGGHCAALCPRVRRRQIACIIILVESWFGLGRRVMASHAVPNRAYGKPCAAKHHHKHANGDMAGAASVMQIQKAVAAHLPGEQLPPFGFELQCFCFCQHQHLTGRPVDQVHWTTARYIWPVVIQTGKLH